jgi:hypothetical protein
MVGAMVLAGCGALFVGSAASRNVSTAEIAAARAQLDSRGFDRLVNALAVAQHLGTSTRHSAPGTNP